MYDKFIKALVLVEDRRFYKHSGIDIISICRAFLINIRERRFVQGGSTITQQLARTLFLDNRKTITRKLKEIAIALFLELGYSKKSILYLYLTNVYMGSKNGYNINGFMQASMSYFSKTIMDLSITEYAALIAMVKGPNIYKPDSELGIARRIMVLGKMLDNNLITKEEFFEASRVRF